MIIFVFMRQTFMAIKGYNSLKLVSQPMPLPSQLAFERQVGIKNIGHAQALSIGFMMSII